MITGVSYISKVIPIKIITESSTHYITRVFVILLLHIPLSTPVNSLEVFYIGSTDSICFDEIVPAGESVVIVVKGAAVVGAAVAGA